MPRKLCFVETDRRTGGGAADREHFIRCPKCAWRPGKRDRWSCACGHQWNTFDTRGVCPACDTVWRDTQCHRCHAWSPHDDWYASDPPAS